MARQKKMEGRLPKGAPRGAKPIPEGIKGSLFLNAGGYWVWKLDSRKMAKPLRGQRADYESARQALIAVNERPETLARNGKAPTARGKDWSRATFEEWCYAVLDPENEEMCIAHLDESTLALYRSTLRQWVLGDPDKPGATRSPELGLMPLAKVGEDEIARVRQIAYGAVRRRQIPLSTYNNVCSALSAVLRKASRPPYRYVPRDVHQVMWLEREEKEALRRQEIAEAPSRYVTVDDRLKYLAEAKGESAWVYGPLFFSLVTGTRIAEPLGITWDQVFLDAPIPFVTLRTQAKRVRGKLTFKPLKKATSKGEIALPAKLCAYLRELRGRQVFLQGEAGVPVFTSKTGGLIDVRELHAWVADVGERLGILTLGGERPTWGDLCRRGTASERSRLWAEARKKGDRRTMEILSKERGAEVARHDAAMQDVYAQRFVDDEELLRDRLAEKLETVEAMSAPILRAI